MRARFTARRPASRGGIRAGATLIAIAALLITASGADARQRPKATAADDPVVTTRDGAVRGLIVGDTVSFRGLPYAAPPVGTLRWRAPAYPRTMASSQRLLAPTVLTGCHCRQELMRFAFHSSVIRRCATRWSLLQLV